MGIATSHTTMTAVVAMIATVIATVIVTEIESMEIVAGTGHLRAAVAGMQRCAATVWNASGPTATSGTQKVGRPDAIEASHSASASVSMGTAPQQLPDTPRPSV